MTRVWLLLIGVFLWPLSSAAQWDPTQYDISFVSTQTQEDLLNLLIHKACAITIQLSQPLPVYCTQNAPPDDQACTCVPSVAQKRSFIVQRYLTPGFQRDAGELYEDRARLYRQRYPTENKATRDALDTLLGLPPLP